MATITIGERIQKFRTAIGHIRQSDPTLTMHKIGVASGVDRRTVAKLLSKSTAPDTIREHTISSLEKYVDTQGEPRGFVAADIYVIIAAGMGATLDNESFAENYEGAFCVLRAHVPSTRPLMSKLVIQADKERRVIRYRHFHRVSDALSLLPKNENKREEATIEYSGFVFNCGNRAFLLSTAPDTGHVKEMILNLRPGRLAQQATIRGLLLTLSADEREPFAARVLVQKMSEKDLQSQRWKPGLKNWNWADPQGFGDRPEILREFSPEQNFGLLRLHA